MYRLDGQLANSTVLGLQGVAGNAAISRQIAAGAPLQRLWGKKKKPTDAELKELKKGGHNQTTDKGDVAEVGTANTAEHVQEGLAQELHDEHAPIGARHLPDVLDVVDDLR